MNSVISWALDHQTAYIELLRNLVECESPTSDPAAVNRFVDLLGDTLSAQPALRAKLKTLPGGTYGKHLLCEFPAKRGAGQILVLSHSDTVWPLGTLQTMPFRHSAGRLWGPGALDMKGGIAIFLFAMRALAELEISLPHRVLLQVNSDEETGSASSRALTEKNARRSRAVLVLEPGSGLAGHLKTARKGVGVYRVQVHGKAAHAGVDFGNGASAILELARQIERIAGFTDQQRGITVNPGLVSGGTGTNVIAAEAETSVDLRVGRLKDAALLDRRFRALKPFDKRCRIEVTGGLNRPPMERSPGIARLYDEALRVGRETGVQVTDSSTGGGSDGNFTAALGIPTLDGLGAVGEGAHAANESIVLDRVPGRIALLAGLLRSPL